MASNNPSTLSSYKDEAKRLKEYLAQAGISLKHSNALEAVAQMHGFKNFHVLSEQALPDGYVRDYRLEALKQVFEDRLTNPINQNIGDYTLDGWEGLLEAHTEMLDDIEEYVFPFMHQDCVLSAARIQMNPFDGKALLRVCPYVSDDGKSSYVANAIRVAQYLQDVAIPTASEMSVDEFMGDEMVEALVRAHAIAGYNSWAHDDFETAIEQTRLAGVVGLSSDEDECPYADGQRVAQVLALLHKDVASAVACIPDDEDEQDIFDECVHTLLRLEQGIACSRPKGSMNILMSLILTATEDADIVDEELSTVACSGGLIDDEDETPAGEWFTVDVAAAVALRLRRNPPLMKAFRSMLIG